MMSELWTPDDARVAPTSRKKEGGTHFDDELETVASAATKQQRNSLTIRDHLNQRPDHVIFVGSEDDRREMMKVVEFWYKKREIADVRPVRVDYRVPVGSIQIREDAA